MGVYIRGMEMPKNCIKCKLCVSYKCVLTGEIRWSDEFDYDSKRFEDCPLVPVPPHGRLIDADALITKDNKDYEAALDATTTVATKSMIMRIHEQMQSVISETPTIIPAEPCKEKGE